MSKRQVALTFAVALVVGFCGSLLGATARRAEGVVNAAPAAPAREGEGGAGAWEYCAVLKAQYPASSREVYWISYFRGERMTVENVEAPPGGNAFSKAVNRLGLEGWEMVGQGPLEVRTGLPGQNAPAVFFKRRREDR